MVAKKKADAPANEPFDITQFQRAKRYVWREIERPDSQENESLKPLRVKLLDLSIGQTNDIPLTMKTALSEVFPIIAPFVAEWDFTAENKQTGEVIPVPPPAEAGPEVFDLLATEEAGSILSWLKFPQQMRSAEEKKASTE